MKLTLALATVVAAITAFVGVAVASGNSGFKPYLLSAPSSVTATPCGSTQCVNFNATITNNTASDVNCQVLVEEFGTRDPYPYGTVPAMGNLVVPITESPFVGSSFPSKLTLDLYCGSGSSLTFVKGQSQNVRIAG